MLTFPLADATIDALQFLFGYTFGSIAQTLEALPFEPVSHPLSSVENLLNMLSGLLGQ